MDLEKMTPGLDGAGLMNLFMEGQWQVFRGPIERFPEFLRPDDGALSNIRKLDNWRQYHVGYRDQAGQYHQVKGSGNSALAHYDKGALVNSRSIEGASDAAKEWLGEWAGLLGVSRDALRLNSWAVKDTGGIDWHFDCEEVIHFQIKGDKLFRFLRTPDTHFADSQTKKFEKIMAAQLNFAEACEEIVGEGTITVIPRGVWHWSEGKSEESFAVSLCVNPPTFAQTLSRSIYKRLRLLERYRMPLFGPADAQRDAMEACAKEAAAFLNDIRCESVLLEECRLELLADRIDTYYFYIGQRANAKLGPLRLVVDGEELVIEGSDKQMAVLETVCKLGTGFRARDIGKLLPHVDAALVTELLAALVRSGFLDFVDIDLAI